MLKRIILIQTAEILPSTSIMMKELGWKGTYRDLSDEKIIELKKTYVLNKNSLKRFLESRNLLGNEDAIIYLTSKIPPENGIYSTTFMFYQ